MSDSPWGIVLLGVGSALVGAGVHKAATDPIHQQQLQQAFDQGRAYERSQIAWEHQQYQNQLQAKDAENARLNEVVQNLARVVAQGSVQDLPALPPPGSNTHHQNGHNQS